MYIKLYIKSYTISILYKIKTFYYNKSLKFLIDLILTKIQNDQNDENDKNMILII